jgi:hypothetical protein
MVNPVLEPSSVLQNLVGHTIGLIALKKNDELTYMQGGWSLDGCSPIRRRRCRGNSNIYQQWRCHAEHPRGILDMHESGCLAVLTVHGYGSRRLSHYCLKNTPQHPLVPMTNSRGRSQNCQQWLFARLPGPCRHRSHLRYVSISMHNGPRCYVPPARKSASLLCPCKLARMPSKL